jgi:thiol-disulfide isomerase/thioredoxin
VSPLAVGDVAPAVPQAPDGAFGVFFFKVTCPTCQLAAPVMTAFERALPGRVIGVGQDPDPKLARFRDEYDLGIVAIEDPPPYGLSDAYEIVSVPTLYLVDDGEVADVVGAWDRSGFNRVAGGLAERLGADPFVVSTDDDGRPDFKPG